jgi:beta-glucanase (GH16 family)
MKIKNLFVISIFLSSFIFGCNSTENVTEPIENNNDSLAIEGFMLVWNDEFNVDGTPDDSKWGYDIGGHGWGNNELQYYTSDSVNVRVNNGKLEIEAHYYPDLAIKYTSARIVTKGKGDWKYGRVEVKAKLPGGLGTWPAIWMLPTDWEYGGWPASGEIDIMEHVGYQPNVVHGTVHTDAFNHSIGSQVGNNVTISTAISDFHIYAIEWYEDRIDFYIDDDKYFYFENQNKSYREWPFDKRFHLIMNVAFGGNWGGAQGIDNSIFPVKMEIEYVRVYEIE